MTKVIRSADYCNLLNQGVVQEGADISAVERIYVKAVGREEIRIAWYKEKDGRIQFLSRPLDLPEDELLKLMEVGIEAKVFSKEFKEKLKGILEKDSY